MIWTALGQALAALAWAFLRWYLERQSVRDDERRKIAMEALEQINLALDWKANHPVDLHGDIRDDFRVRPNAPKPKRLSPDDPNKADP